MVSRVKGRNLKAETMPLVFRFAGYDNIGSRPVSHARRYETIIDEQLDFNLLIRVLLTDDPALNGMWSRLSPALEMGKCDQKKPDRQPRYQNDLDCGLSDKQLNEF
jgi:hypothetical protein